MKKLTAGVVSSHSRFCEVEANFNHFAAITRRMAGRGARLICFPELALTSYTTDRAVLDVAEPIPGPITDKLCDLASLHNVYLSVGMTEQDTDRYHITQIIVGPDGYLGKYRKHHPTGGELACGFSPGDGFPVFDIDGFRLGVNICFDGRHQDTIAAVRDARVDLIHHPHGNELSLGRDAEEWTRGKMVYFVPRAVQARAYILINNSAGDTQNPSEKLSYGSGAMMLDPLGQVVKRTKQHTRTEKTLVATITKPLSEHVPEFEMARLQAE